MEASKTNIDKFLGRTDTYFRIPDFQRQYSWHKENCEVFLSDFEEAIKENKTHYMGCVFFQQVSRDESVVIDGQQRITTILLMLIAIYHILQDKPELCADANLAKRINREFLENEYAQEGNRVKLRGITDDDRIFKRIYTRKTQNTDETSNLYKAYSHFYDYLTERFTEGLDPEIYINGLRHLKVISIELNEEDNLQKIFEGINSTGVTLSEGDKIRNFALMLSSDKVRKKVTEDYWTKIEQGLVDTSRGSDYIADFFHNFLIIHLEQTIKSGEIYTKFKTLFKERVKDQKDVEQVSAFYSTIIDDLERYLVLKLNRQIDDRYVAFKRQAFRINYLGFEIVYPFLMCVLRDYKDNKLTQEEVREFFSVTESYLVRRIVAGITSQGLNKLFHTLYRDIVAYSKENENARYIDIYKYILLNRQGASRFPTMQHVKSRFTDSNIGNKNRYFILSSWDDYKQSKESFLLQQVNAYSIEHIMPQTPTPEWERELGANHKEIHEQYLNCLANLTLTGYNPEYSNKSFQEKLNHKNGYMQSTLLINEFVKQQTQWNEDTLKARIDWWIDVIEEIWPTPQTNFQPKTKGAKTLTLADMPEDLYYSKPVSITIRDSEPIRANHWHGLLDCFLDAIYELDEEIIPKLENEPETTKWISHYPEDFHSSVEIADTGYHVNTNNQTISKVDFMKHVADLAAIDRKDIAVELLLK